MIEIKKNIFQIVSDDYFLYNALYLAWLQEVPDTINRSRDTFQGEESINFMKGQEKTDSIRCCLL